MNKITSTLLASTMMLLANNGAPQTENAHWGYTGHNAPDTWGSLSPKYLTCSEGKNQSPIDVRSSMDAELEPLIISYPKGSKEIINNGHTIQVDIEEGNTLVVDGIAYSHNFASGVMGRPVTSANSLLTKKHMSCFAGHQQGRQIAYARKADGSEITAIIAGSCYEHNEDYLNIQGNQHWRGFYVLHEVNNGSFDEMAVSLNYVNKNYSLDKRRKR